MVVFYTFRLRFRKRIKAPTQHCLVQGTRHVAELAGIDRCAPLRRAPFARPPNSSRRPSGEKAAAACSRGAGSEAPSCLGTNQVQLARSSTCSSLRRRPPARGAASQPHTQRGRAAPAPSCCTRRPVLSSRCLYAPHRGAGGSPGLRPPNRISCPAPVPPVGSTTSTWPSRGQGRSPRVGCTCGA